MKHSQSTRGFNLVEAAIVLGVIGLVIGGIWIAASSVREKNLTQQLAQDLQLIVANTSNGIHGMPEAMGGGPTISELIAQAGWAPSSWQMGPALPDFGSYNSLRFGNYQIDAEVWFGGYGHWRLDVFGTNDCTALANAVRNFVRRGASGVYRITAIYDNDPAYEIYNTEAVPPVVDMPIGKYCIDNAGTSVTAFQMYIKS